MARTGVRVDEAKLTRARYLAVQRFPYLATGLFALTVVGVEGLGTFAVDQHWRMYVDPRAVRRWTDSQVAAVWVHELHHLLREHAGRARRLGLGSHDRSVWNLAADAEINDDDFGDLALPGRAVTPTRLGLPAHRTAEEYYRALRGNPRQVPDEGSGVHGVPGPWELPADDDSLPPAQAGLVRRDVARRIRERARRRGDVPAGLVRLADVILGDTQDWRRLLAVELRRSLAVTAGRLDHSYARISRRAQVSPGVVLPAMVEPTPQVAVIIDTSASIDDEQLGRALGETLTIVRSAGSRGCGVTLVACDAQAAPPTVVRTAAALGQPLLGGGGTDLREGFEAVRRLRPVPEIVIVFTDGLTPWPDRPRAQVVVALLDAPPEVSPPSWTRVVRIDRNDTGAWMHPT